jgi:hypothetical protein
MVRFFGFLLFIFLLNVSLAEVKIKEELDFITRHSFFGEKHVFSSPFFSQTSSEIKIFFLGLIRFYQLFISSQHGRGICFFTPSCSGFGFEAIKRAGVFWGILITADRLQRCHSLGLAHYSKKNRWGRYFDPVDLYLGGNK